MDLLKRPEQDDEPTHKANIIWEFLAYVRAKGIDVIDVALYVEEFKEQYRD